MKSQLNLELRKGIFGYPIVYIPHFHQKLILNETKEICKEYFGEYGDEKLLEIECTHESILAADPKKGYEYCSDIVNQLSEFIKDIYTTMRPRPAKELCVIKNVTAKLLKDSRFSSLLHQFAEYYEDYCENNPILTIILCVPSCELPPSGIYGISYVVNVIPPTFDEIRSEIDTYGMTGISEDNSFEISFARALQGVHLYDVRQIIMSTKNIYNHVITNNTIKWAQDQKKQLVRKTGILEVIEPNVELSDVGGLSNIIERIKQIAKLYKHIDILKDACIPLPKGFLLLGMPGCGKSMIAKATANEFDCPLIKLDMGKLLGKYVGDSDHNLQLALEVVDSAHPCVLWIDEIEKAFAGTNNASRDGDAVMMRLLGKFLSWMQERDTAVFIMATANDVLKPELMRKGRFDEVFFVDLPSNDEAKAIICKTIEKYSKNIREKLYLFLEENNNLTKVAKLITDIKDVPQNGQGAIMRRGLSGAEIKSMIDSYVSDSLSIIIGKSKQNHLPQLDQISFDEEKFYAIVDDAIKSAMINQKHSGKIDEKEQSFIDKIYKFKITNNFKDASGPIN